MKTIIAGLLLLTSVLVFAEVVSTRDVIYTRDGEEHRGELVEITPLLVRFDSPQGVREIDRDEVVSIELGKKRAGDIWRTLEDIDDELLLRFIENKPPLENFAGANYAVLYDCWRIRIMLDGTIKQNHREITQLYSEGAKDQVALSEIYYYPDIEMPQIIHARSISPSGQVLHLDESAVERGPVNAFVPDYDRLNILKYALGEVAVGTIIDISERVTRKGSSPLDPYYVSIPFYEEGPVLHREVVLEVETGAEPAFGEINWPADWPEMQVKSGPAFTTYTWSIENIPPVFPESNMPPQAKYSPFVVISGGEDWEDIALEFNRKISEAQEIPPRLNQIIEKTLPGKNSDREKARALYSWVMDEIGYIPVGAGIYSFEPQKISQILTKQYCNDLDRAFLFYMLSKRAGLNVQFVFSSTHETVFCDDVPSLFSTPSPLVYVNLSDEEDKELIIDLSSDYLPFRCVRGSVMGEKAVVFDGNSARLTIIPKPPLSREGQASKVTIIMNPDGSIHGQLHERFFGNRQEDIREYRYATEDEIRQAMEERVSKIHHSAHLDGWRLQNIGDLGTTPELFAEFSAPDYAIKAGDKYLAFKIPDLDYSTWGTGAQSRDWPIWFDTPYCETHEIDVKLPKGYKIYAVPEDTISAGDSISYLAEFSEKRGNFIFRDNYSRSRLAFPPNMYPLYKEYRHVQAAVANMWIVLERDR